MAGLSAWKQFAVACDQLLNTTLRDGPGLARGWADETISSRCWRLSATLPTWERRRAAVDWVALHVFKEKDHCLESFTSERLMRQFPPELRWTTPISQPFVAKKTYNPVRSVAGESE